MKAIFQFLTNINTDNLRVSLGNILSKYIPIIIGFQ